LLRSGPPSESARSPLAPRSRFVRVGRGSSFLVRYVSGGLLFLKPGAWFKVPVVQDRARLAPQMHHQRAHRRGHHRSTLCRSFSRELGLVELVGPKGPPHHLSAFATRRLWHKPVYTVLSIAFQSFGRSVSLLHGGRFSRLPLHCFKTRRNRLWYGTVR
jgi:hypothetical protein